MAKSKTIKSEEIIGKKFGNWTILEKTNSVRWSNGKPARRFICRCVCGIEKPVLYSNLREDVTHGCGCIRNQQSTKHGDWKSSEYRSWIQMRSRCSKPYYKNWNGRGITVCERWQNSYENFLFDMGRKPTSNHSLDRIDNNGNYEKSNCKWSTRSEQQRNKRPSTFSEKTHPKNRKRDSLGRWK